MTSDMISYAVLASAFVVTCLRMFVEKPGRVSESPLMRSELKPVNENSSRHSSED